MSEPVTNVQIEDVLSSIRKLVSEEVRAQTRARHDEVRPTRPASAVEAKGRAAFVLTPALRVPADQAEELAPADEAQVLSDGRADRLPDPSAREDALEEDAFGEAGTDLADDFEDDFGDDFGDGDDALLTEADDGWQAEAADHAAQDAALADPAFEDDADDGREDPAEAADAGDAAASDPAALDFDMEAFSRRHLDEGGAGTGDAAAETRLATAPVTAPDSAGARRGFDPDSAADLYGIADDEDDSDLAPAVDDYDDEGLNAEDLSLSLAGFETGDEEGEAATAERDDAAATAPAAQKATAAEEAEDSALVTALSGLEELRPSGGEIPSFLRRRGVTTLEARIADLERKLDTGPARGKVAAGHRADEDLEGEDLEGEDLEGGETDFDADDDPTGILSEIGDGPATDGTAFAPGAGAADPSEDESADLDAEDIDDLAAKAEVDALDDTGAAGDDIDTEARAEARFEAELHAALGRGEADHGAEADDGAVEDVAPVGSARRWSRADAIEDAEFEDVLAEAAATAQMPVERFEDILDWENDDEDELGAEAFEGAAGATCEAAAMRRSTAEDAPAGGAMLDEEALRQLVAEIIRQELQGALGERITRNVRKLVRREIQRAMTSNELL